MKNDSNSKITSDSYIVNATIKVLILIHMSSAVAVAVLTTDADYLALCCYYFSNNCSCLSQLINKFSKVLAVPLLFNN